jgi:TetR/AcrR family transcriptional regulator, cholesterol catabolism regulator
MKSGQQGEQIDRQARILEAALDLLSRHGISGANPRAVARHDGHRR